MNDRKKTIESFLIECCQASSIYYDGKLPSIKYLRGKGTVVFFERSRMLDLVERTIPDYDEDVDEKIIETIIQDSDKLMICESHEYRDCHYCLSVMLKD